MTVSTENLWAVMITCHDGCWSMSKDRWVKDIHTVTWCAEDSEAAAIETARKVGGWVAPWDDRFQCRPLRG